MDNSKLWEKQQPDYRETEFQHEIHTIVFNMFESFIHFGIRINNNTANTNE